MFCLSASQVRYAVATTINTKKTILSSEATKAAKAANAKQKKKWPVAGALLRC